MLRIKDFCKSLCSKVKQLDALHIIVMGIIILIIILLVINGFASVKHAQDYENRKNSGNDRWNQVESIIRDTELKVNELEQRLTELENK